MNNNPLKNNKGLVHVYTGDGKGKTTCALGLALRVIGWGGRVCMVQFIKGYSEIGEAKFAQDHPQQFVLKQFAVDSSRNINEDKTIGRKDAAEAALKCAAEVISSADYDLVILDEINNAMHYKLVSIQSVVQMVQQKPQQLELVMTGRNVPDKIVEVADYVTIMQMVKHPYTKNIGARQGIDY